MRCMQHVGLAVLSALRYHDAHSWYETENPGCRFDEATAAGMQARPLECVCFTLADLLELDLGRACISLDFCTVAYD